MLRQVGNCAFDRTPEIVERQPGALRVAGRLDLQEANSFKAEPGRSIADPAWQRPRSLCILVRMDISGHGSSMWTF